MLRTRRGFFNVLRPEDSYRATALLLAARGHEAYVAELQAQGRTARPPLPPGVNEIRISSNENPLGPGRRVLDAIVGKFPEAGRYPFNSTPSDATLVATLANASKARPENVTLGAGSQEILKSAVRAFTAADRGLVTAAPTFENPTNIAKRLGHPVKEIQVDAAFKLDVEKMIAASTSRISTGWSVTAAARSGRLHISRMPWCARIARYSFMYRPACRMNHTGRTSVGRRRQASRNRLFIGATRMRVPICLRRDTRESL